MEPRDPNTEPRPIKDPFDSLELLVGEMVRAEIAKAMAPLAERIEKLEHTVDALILSGGSS